MQTNYDTYVFLSMKAFLERFFHIYENLGDQINEGVRNESILPR